MYLFIGDSLSVYDQLSDDVWLVDSSTGVVLPIFFHWVPIWVWGRVRVVNCYSFLKCWGSKRNSVFFTLSVFRGVENIGDNSQTESLMGRDFRFYRVVNTQRDLVPLVSHRNSPIHEGFRHGDFCHVYLTRFYVYMVKMGPSPHGRMKRSATSFYLKTWFDWDPTLLRLFVIRRSSDLFLHLCEENWWRGGKWKLFRSIH